MIWPTRPVLATAYMDTSGTVHRVTGEFFVQIPILRVSSAPAPTISPDILEKNQKFSRFQKIFMLLKNINDYQKVL
jgi:hypothetical protein